MEQENKELPKGGGVEELKALFAKEGLDFPSVSERFHAELKELSPFLYSTRSDEAPDPYVLDWFLDEVQTKKVDDYLIIGNTGHGVNSWAMHVYFVDGPFACFLQKHWGGAFGDAEIAREQFNSALLAIEQLRLGIADAVKANKIKEGHCLVLVESDFFGNRWTWMEKGSGMVEEEAWKTEEPSFLYAWASIPKI